MKAHELIKELQKWPDLPMYFEYALAEEATVVSEDGTMVAECVSEDSMKMIFERPVSDGRLNRAMAHCSNTQDQDDAQTLESYAAYKQFGKHISTIRLIDLDKYDTYLDDDSKKEKSCNPHRRRKTVAWFSLGCSNGKGEALDVIPTR